MRILFAGGGTAGHINPALAIAGYIKERHPDAEISYIGTAQKLEAKLVPEKGYDFYTIDVAGFQRSLSPSSIIKNVSAVKKAQSDMSAELADINEKVVKESNRAKFEEYKLQSKVDGLVADNNEENNFLLISDLSGNVLAKISKAGIITKNFNSSKIAFSKVGKIKNHCLILNS